MGKDNWNFNLPLFVSSVHAGLHFVITACLMHFWPEVFDATRSGKGGRLTIHSYVTQVVSFFCLLFFFLFPDSRLSKLSNNKEACPGKISYPQRECGFHGIKVAGTSIGYRKLHVATK